jgi:hypothetical protein
MIFIWDVNFKVVVIFSLVNLKVWLVSFKSDAIQSSLAQHHLWAFHEIVHYVFKNWNEILWINCKKVNFFICDHLESWISLNEINLSPHFWNFMILTPFSCFLINFKEKNRIWRSHDQSLIKQKIHRSKIFIRNFLTFEFFWILRINCESMTLSVKCIAIICNRAVKRFDWKI